MTALAFSIGILSFLVGLILSNSYRHYRAVLKLEKEIGADHEWPTFRSWNREVWKVAVSDFRRQIGLKP